MRGGDCIWFPINTATSFLASTWAVVTYDYFPLHERRVTWVTEAYFVHSITLSIFFPSEISLHACICALAYTSTALSAAEIGTTCLHASRAWLFHGFELSTSWQSSSSSSSWCVCVYVCACVFFYVCACVLVCMCARACACVCSRLHYVSYYCCYAFICTLASTGCKNRQSP